MYSTCSVFLQFCHSIVGMRFPNIFSAMHYFYSDELQEYCKFWIDCQTQFLLKGPNGVCFALKLSNYLLLLFTYLITLGKDITFPLIIKLKTNSSLSSFSVNRIPNEKCDLTD